MNRVDPPARWTPADWCLMMERLLVFIVMAVGVLLRFYHLDSIPPGLRYDEAYNGVDALRILDGARPIFLSGNFGREALFIYAQALSIGILGPTGLALRAVAAICGILTLPMAYLLARRLFGGRVALLTVAWLSVSLWHVIFSRIGLRTIALPLVAGATLYCLVCGLEPLWTEDKISLSEGPSTPSKACALWLALAGFLLGVSLYTYTAARFLPFVIVGFVVYVLLTHPRSWKPALGSLLLVGVIALLVFTPEGIYFARHPDTFVQRASEVSIFNPSVNGGSVAGSLLHSAERSFGMFVVEGDDNWDRNIPGQPVFGPLSAIFLGIGLIRILRALQQPPNALLVIWVLVMIIPGILAARDVPNFLHYTGILPGLYMIPALGADAIWTYWERHGAVARHLLPVFVFSAVFLAGMGGVYRAYFGTWAHSPDVAFLFDADRYLTLQTGRAMARTSETPIDLAAGDASSPLVNYLLASYPSSHLVRAFDGSRSLIFPPSSRPLVYLFSAIDLPPASLMQQFFGGAPGTVVSSTLAGAPVTRLVLAESPPNLVPTTPLPSRFGNSVEVLGFDVPKEVQAGQNLTVHWYWRIRATDARSLSFTNQVFDDANHRLGILDDRAFAPGYWPAGTEGISTFTVPVDGAATTGAVWLKVAIYDRATLDHLPVFDAQGRPLGDSLQLGPIKLHGTAPPPPRISHPRLAHFADNIDLLGYDVAPVGAHQTQLTLYWSPRGRPAQNYTVFVHALGSDGKLVGQADAPPRGGGYPTSVWDAGETIVDRHVVDVDPSKVSSFAIGLYLPANGQRVAVVGGPGEGDSVTLANILR